MEKISSFENNNNTDKESNINSDLSDDLIDELTDSSESSNDNSSNLDSSNEESLNDDSESLEDDSESLEDSINEKTVVQNPILLKSNNHRELLWESNFSNFNELLKHWTIEYLPVGYVNNELQSYNNNKNINLYDNILNIKTLKNGHDIQSGRLNSKGKLEFQYGYIEGLMKFTEDKGLWPAFWCLGNNLKWPDRGEIDIMEWVAWNRTNIYGTLHGPGYCGANAYGSGPRNVLNKSFANEYHKYAIEWKPNSIIWYVDDIEYFRASHDELKHKKGNVHWVFNDRPFYFILNVAVGGDFGGAYKNSKQDILNNMRHENNFDIKYIKIYKTDDGHGNITCR